MPSDSTKTTHHLKVLLAGMLLAALAMFAALYPRLALPLYGPGQQAQVERTQAWAATQGHVPREQVERETFAIAISMSDRTCVELRPWRRHQMRFLVCYDVRTGKPVEERIIGDY